MACLARARAAALPLHDLHFPSDADYCGVVIDAAGAYGRDDITAALYVDGMPLRPEHSPDPDQPWCCDTYQRHIVWEAGPLVGVERYPDHGCGRSSNGPGTLRRAAQATTAR